MRIHNFSNFSLLEELWKKSKHFQNEKEHHQQYKNKLIKELNFTRNLSHFFNVILR